jgi:CheY-like chemotaxis protein
MQNKKKVLVVDDDEMHLYTTKELLQNNFIDVTTHKSWFGATNRVKELEPDLILLDINMPALSGDKLADILKPYCEARKTAIVFHSSNDEDSLRELAKSHGVQGYICKGDVADLRNKVNWYLKMQA